MRFSTFGRSALAAFGLMLAAALPAAADEAAGKLAAAHLEAGTLAEGETALAALIASDAGNDDARLGLAAIKFVRAVERLSQGLYRYGLQPPANSFLLPVVRLPVPVNPNPEPITYADFRKLLETFVGDLGATEAVLAAMGTKEVRLPLDLGKIRYDADGSGTAGEDERFLSVIERVTGLGPESLPSSLFFVFDRGDAIWLRGYSQVLMAFGDFFLAHDWQESFDYTFHIFFPRSDLPFTRALDKAGQSDFTNIADFISFIHVRWPVTEPARLTGVRERLKTVIALSRQSWEVIEAETDDDNEWLPNPKQTSRFVGFRVDVARLSAWRAVLDEAELILDGKKLVPHWRFTQGFNFRRVFDEPRPFDLVLWIAGPAALPYLEDGPIETGENWNRILDAFGDSFGAYMAWFN